MWDNSLHLHWILAAALIWGCQARQESKVASPMRPSTDQAVESVIDLPAPPGLDAQAVATWDEQSMAQAVMTLDQIIDGLAQPSYLADPDDDHPSDSDDHFADGSLANEPPIAAQHAYLRARSAWRDGRRFDAIRQLQSALRLWPNSATILRRLGMIYTRSGNKVRGASYLKQAVAIEPADVESLIVLARQAVSQLQWDEAIATLAYARGLDQADSDPAFRPLLQYLLGNALIQRGYDQAGVAQLAAYLNYPTGFRRTTTMARELIVLSRQRRATWQAIGDALHRLNKPIEALSAYEQAREASSDDVDSDLAHRLVYTYLRLKQPTRAQEVALPFVQQSDSDSASIGLMQYVATHGGALYSWIDKLQQLYEDNDRPSALATTIAGMLDDVEAGEFLAAHLALKPEDQDVLKVLVDRLFGQADLRDDTAAMTPALDATLIAMSALPEKAEAYGSILVDAVPLPEALFQAIGGLPTSRLQQPMPLLIRAMVLIRMGKSVQAIEDLERVVNQAPQLDDARLKLAELLIDDGRFERAAGLLAAFADPIPAQVARLRVRIMREEGQIEEAIELLVRVQAQGVVDPQLTIEQAQLYLARQDAEAAEKSLLRGIDKLPHEESLYEALLRLYESGRIENPAQRYQNLLQRVLSAIPKSRLARLERARLLMARNRLDEAEPILRQLVDEREDDLKAIESLLSLLLKADRAEEAQSLLDGCLKTDPENRQILSLALRYYQQVDHQPMVVDIAKRLVKQLVNDQTKDAGSIDTLLEMIVEAGQVDVADQLVEEHLVVEPTDRDLLALAQRYFDRTKNHERLFETTLSLLLMQPSSPTRTLSLAVLYLRYDRARDAVPILTEAWQNDPGDNPRLTVTLLGRALSETDQRIRADQVFREAINRYPDQAEDIRFDWAMLCERRGDKDQAQQLLVQLLGVQPDHVLANNALGYTWADQGKHLEKALPMIQLAVDADPGNAAYLDSMGWVRYKLGQFDEAVRWLERAKSAPGGEYPVILDHLGDAYYRVNQKEDALNAWQEAKDSFEELDPDSINDDAELGGLKGRLDSKIRAVKHNHPASIAESVKSDQIPDQPLDTPSLPQPTSTTDSVHDLRGRREDGTSP